MYFYLFDAFLKDKKFKSEVTEVENRVAELGLTGRMVHLSILKNFNEPIRDAIERGTPTIVLVGNDQTLNRAINFIADTPVTLGFIPLGEPVLIAQFLGIPSGKFAVDVLANRLTEKLDLGKINDDFFLSSVQFEADDFFLDCDEKYQISFKRGQKININNLFSLGHYHANPKDGLLEILVTKKYGSFLSTPEIRTEGLFFSKKIMVKPEGKNYSFVLADGIKQYKPPVQVELVSHKLKIIVGRDRVF